MKGVEPLWQKKNEEVMEQEFQKDLEVCTDVHVCNNSYNRVQYSIA